MKKLILLAICILSFGYSKACVDYDPEYEYYNLFMQELISDPQYYPFLLTYSSGYYVPVDSSKLKNENIEQWQRYLGLGYEETFYLVNKSRRADLLSVMQGKKMPDTKLAFLTPAFVIKQNKALRYLAYAKYLEPFMTFSSGTDDSWGYRPDTTIANLNYNKAIVTLTRSWQAETDKELKLRYGYQLVRIAHYKRHYKMALKYFNDYVESLNYRPAIYYYALDQKAGAEKGLKMYNAANYDFFQVFTHIRDRKESAFQSMRFVRNPDFKVLLRQMKSNEERNDLYLMLGYINFNNPLSSLQNIVSTSPDAIQAKVLMARAINSLERELIPTGSYWDFCDTCYLNVKDKRFPIIEGSKSTNFFKKLLAFSKQMTINSKVKDSNYWNLTTAYLCFLSKDFVQADAFLDRVTPVNKLYADQKQNLAMYTDICKQPKISDEVERMLYAKYRTSFDRVADSSSWEVNNFLDDVLANRYFLQKDFAKSFLMNNDITALESNPDLQLLDALDALYHKKDKNEFEKMLLGRMIPRNNQNNEVIKGFDVQSYINNMRGTVYLSRGELNLALQAFRKVQAGFFQFDLSKNQYESYYHWPKSNFNGFSGISRRIFGCNIIERFGVSEDTVMQVSYLSEFPQIKASMNKCELTQVLLNLEEIALKQDEMGAKAAYLLGNFYYNTTNIGYYRHILRFDQDNSHCEKYNYTKLPDYSNNIYLKYYGSRYFFNNNLSLPQQYLEKALQLSHDPELKAQIVFALSKCEQGTHYESLFKADDYYWINDNDILIKNRKYFRELRKYGSTTFYSEVRTNCLYFNYYISHY